jgi:hypothetical protein
VNAELRVRIFEMLSNGSGGEPQLSGNLEVRQPAGDEVEDLPLSRREQLGPGVRRAPSQRGPPELLQMAAQKIEHLTVPLAKASSRTVEFEAGAGRVEPEAHHVFDAEGPDDLAVEVEAVEVAERQEVGELPRALSGCERVFMGVAHLGDPHLRGDLAARLAGERHRRVSSRSLVVGDNIARDQAPKRLQNSVRKCDRPVNGPGFTDDLQDASVIAFGETRHEVENTTNVVSPEGGRPRMIGGCGDGNS